MGLQCKLAHAGFRSCHAQGLLDYKLSVDFGSRKAEGLRQARTAGDCGLRRALLARGTPAVAYESGLKERVVISEFPSVEKAIAAHDSAAYQDALKALGNGAVRDLRIVEGLE